MTFRILTVCTGNVCRSPQAEQLLRAGFKTAHTIDSEWDVPTISSAGTFALVGEGMPPQAAILSREYGGDAEGHRARQLTAQLIEEADVVLALAREHRGAVARLSPRASRKTFTLREFARALGGGESPAFPTQVPAPGEFAEWVIFATKARGLNAASAEDDDVIDPYRRSDATYKGSIGQIIPAVNYIVLRLTTKVGDTQAPIGNIGVAR